MTFADADVNYQAISENFLIIINSGLIEFKSL